MFKKRCMFLLIYSIVVLLLGNPAFAEHGEKKPVKKGILLVAFGTSVPEAQTAFEKIEKKVRATFPDIPIYWAYTSHIIRQKLAKQGKHLDSVETALSKMMEQGFTHVAVQSLHTIAGEEFHDLYQNVRAFGNMAGGFRRILVGYPLMGTEDDLRQITHVLLQYIPKDRKETDAVVFMGHGTPHPSNAFYAALAYHLQQKDANIFVGTVEGSPTIDEIRDVLITRGIRKAYLMPFMAVAGDHARNDMAGDEPDSWKSILTKAGIECVSVLRGTAEYEGIADIWGAHLKKVMHHFDNLSE